MIDKMPEVTFEALMAFYALPMFEIGGQRMFLVDEIPEVLKPYILPPDPNAPTLEELMEREARERDEIAKVFPTLDRLFGSSKEDKK